MRMYDRENETTEGRTTETTTRRFEGFDARFGTDPDEIYLELRLGSPAYVHLREGDYLQEGDAFHREQIGTDSPTLATWEVVDITPATVVGRDVATGEGVAMDRADVEQGLAVGRYSTNLTEFEWVSVYQVGDWDDYDPDDEGSGTRYTGRPYVAVVAYGDNGLTYGQRYRFVDPDADELVLWKVDRPIRGLPDEVAEQLDARVRTALEAEGFVVTEQVAEP